MPNTSMRQAWQITYQMLRLYPRVLKVVWQAQPRYAALTTIFTICGALARPAQIWISKVFIDRLSSSITANTGGTLDWQPLVLSIGTLFAVWIIGEATLSMAAASRDILMFQFGNYAEHLLLRKSAQMDIAFFETPDFFNKIENARLNISRATNVAFVTIDLIGGLLSLVAMIVLLWRLNPLVVLLLLITTAPQMLVQGIYAKRFFALWNSRTSARRMVRYLSDLLWSRDPVKEIRLFGLDMPFLAYRQRFWDSFMQDMQQVRFSREFQNLAWGLLAMTGTAATWIYAALQAARGLITLGDVALVFQATESVREGLRRIFWAGGQFYENLLFLRDFFDFLDLRQDAVAGALVRREASPGVGATTTGLIAVPRPFVQGIEFRHVFFRYPQTHKDVLQDLSFTLRPGETVALVGANGSGKTTLVKLLARLYDPTAGVILLDGRDLRDYDLDDLRRQIGVIFQDFVRYHLTARENIGFGQIEYVTDLERITAAATQGGAMPIIENLPRGFENMLGRTFDGSVDLSGGEWQKMALSRAFMREAQILILDEPTAALDALAEYEVYQRFADLTSGKTTIFISHRFSTVRMAQHILVLADGKLIEEGTHSKLLALDGQYARMFNTQAEQYR